MMKSRRFGRDVSNSLGVAVTVATLMCSGGAAVAQPAQPPTSSDGSRIGRLSGSTAPEFRELNSYEARALSLRDAGFPHQVRIHRAHALMLAEQGIITKAEAAEILRGLALVDAQAAADPSLRAYLPYESALIRAIGPVAGKLHTGRSRNDLGNTEDRMFYREQINRVIEALIGLRRALVEKAAQNTDTVMVAYTHRKQAQPITLGHYLMAIDENVAKSIDRYGELYGRMNLSPLGSAATAGTGFPIDRDRTRDLLGFDGLVINTIEGVAAWDHIAEFATDNALYMVTLSRFASEMQNWQTDEFNMISLDRSFAGTSSIMPQKLNPSALEATRRVSAQSLGQSMSILASLHAIEYQNSGARAPLDPRSIDALVAATHTMTGVVRTLQPNKPVMLRNAAEGFSTTTELADTIVRESGIDFREAHEVVATVIDEAISQGKTADQVTPAMVQKAARARLGHALKISPQALAAALDPVQNVARRNGVGGPAPAAVQRMVDAARADIIQRQGRLQTRVGRLREADAALERAVEGVKGG